MKTRSVSRSPYPAIWPVILILIAFSINACDTSETDGARIEVLLTDAPLEDVLEANIVIQRIELIDSNGVTVVLSDVEQPFDLLTLQDGVTAPLADVSLSDGTFRQLRVVVSEDASLLMTDSTIQELKIPSGSTSGIKVIDLPEISLADSVERVVITIDFDAEDSFIRAGNSGMYLFRPVIKPYSFAINGVERITPADSTGN